MKIFHPLNKYCMEIQKGLFLAWWIYRVKERKCLSLYDYASGHIYSLKVAWSGKTLIVSGQFPGSLLDSYYKHGVLFLQYFPYR